MKLIAKLPSAPANETPEHFFLKQVALAMLAGKNFGCHVAGVECSVTQDYSNWVAQKERYNLPNNCCGRNVADALGVKFKHCHSSEGRVISIEVKVSASDYKAGFCIGADSNYIMAPKDMLTLDMPPEPIGLIEVEIPKVKTRWGDVSGVRITRRAKKMERSYPHGNREDWVRTTAINIARCVTMQMANHNPWLQNDHVGYQIDAV